MFQSSYPDKKFIDAFEQVGTYDPIVNEHGEKLCALNIERIIYYLAQSIEVSTEVQQLLGLAGLLPQHPETYRAAWRNRAELSRDLPPDLKDTVLLGGIQSERALKKI